MGIEMNDCNTCTQEVNQKDQKFKAKQPQLHSEFESNMDYTISCPQNNNKGLKAIELVRVIAKT